MRDGGDLHIPGYAFAPVFSIWTTIEECLNPPVIWDGDGWRTTEPFSAPEMFPFPEGVGPVECVNVEHEEVLLVPRWVPDVKKVTFKYALGSDFIEKLKLLHDIGLDSTQPVTVSFFVFIVTLMICLRKSSRLSGDYRHAVPAVPVK